MIVSLLDAWTPMRSFLPCLDVGDDAVDGFSAVEIELVGCWFVVCGSSFCFFPFCLLKL
jgi:hypothetical protein